MSSVFLPPDSSLFFTKNDPKDLRLGDFATLNNTLHEFEFGLLGYPDDEGIQLNGGRLGACEAPDRIRKHLYKSTFPNNQQPAFKDLGNLDVSKMSLAERHQSAKNYVTSNLKDQRRLITLGGGHDYGYPDGAGFLEWAKNQKGKPLVLNFDAHLDVRPLDRGLSSGTPFYRLLTEGFDFAFVEIGIQSQCNSPNHLDWLQQQGGHCLSYDQFLASGRSFSDFVLEGLTPFLERQRPCYVSVDIDGFSSAYAMGCSQSWATGMDPDSFFRILNTVIRRTNCPILGIYEVSPPLDLDDRTSKLAALIAHRYILEHMP